MRVVHICGELGFYGAENVVTQLVRHTGDADMDVRVVTINRWEHPETRGAFTFPIEQIDRSGRRDLGFLPRMVAALRRLRPDVVHTHAHHGRYWGRLAAVLAGVPIIVHTEHNPDLTPPAPRWAFDALNRLLARATTAYVDFTAQRRAQLAAAERVPLERIAVIPNGIPALDGPPLDRDAARAELGLAPDELGILVVARLFPQKRQDLAIDAVAALPCALRERVRLLLLGDGPLRDALAERARERGVAEHVRFLGFRLDARRLLAGADVALLSSAREAMPLAIIEAMLEGAPIVSTPWEGARAMLGEERYGLVARDFSAEALANALRDALEDRAAAAARAAEAQAHARVEFDVSTQAARYAALYRALSAGTRAASPAITAARS